MLSGPVSMAIELVYEFLRSSSIVSNVAILNKFNYKMSESDPDSLEYASSDGGSDFESFTAADIREVSVQLLRQQHDAANISGVGAVDGDSSASSDSI